MPDLPDNRNLPRRPAAPAFKANAGPVVAQQQSAQAAIVRDATAHLLRLARAAQHPAQLEAFCTRLHRLAADLDRVPGDRSAATFARLAGLCADVMEGSLPGRAGPAGKDASSSPDESGSAGPGGLGYMMTLSSDDEKAIAPSFRA